MSQHDDTVYLRHMRDHAEEALNIMGGLSKTELVSDRVRLLALCHLAEIVGEAANRVSPSTKARLSVVPWRGMISMRNRIIHGYESMSIDKLWATICDDLPALVATLDERLANEDGDTSGSG